MRPPTVATILSVVAIIGDRAEAFVGNSNILRPSALSGCITSSGTHSCAQPLYMAGSVCATTRASKTKVVEEVTILLNKSSMVFSVPSSGIKGNEVVRLRKTMPDGCTARVVKNTLMRLACKGTPYENLSEITTGENFWMFVEGDDNLAAPIKFLGEFAKTMDKDNEAWQKPLKAGVFAGQILDGPGVLAISKLPTKQELMQRLAVAIKSVPTRLGRGIKLVPTKLGRAVRLAFAEVDGEGGDAAAAESPAVETESSADEGAGDAAPMEEAAEPAGDAAPEADAAAPPAEGGEEAAPEGGEAEAPTPE